MRKRCAGLVLAALVFVVAAVLPAAASAQGHMPPSGPGFLEGPGEWGKIELVGKAIVTDQDDLVADVALDPSHDYAYLANWSDATCAENSEAGGQNAPDAGIWVIDISDPENPVEVGFIPHSQDSRPGEGLQALEVNTDFFSGTILVSNNEQCGKNGKGGVSIWDVTNPLKPKKLSEHFGDREPRTGDTNTIHSVFAWNAGDNAYAVMTDNEEFTDVDILDITNPHRPRLIAELDLNQFGVSQPELGLNDSFLHDMVVKNIDGEWIMLLSYWDGGWVMLNVDDPANPVFIADSDYPEVDPELLESFGTSLTPEGNAHQAEFTIDNRFVIGTDEDFDPFRFAVTEEDGDVYRAAAGELTTPEEAETIAGTTVFVGKACPGDTVPAPPAADGYVAVVERGECLFEEKIQTILAAGGYDAIIIMNREGADACNATLTPSYTTDTVPVVLIGRESGFGLFDQPGFDIDACLEGDEFSDAPIPVGAVGDDVTEIGMVFDGWGYVWLLDAETMEPVDTFAIPEAHDPDFAVGFGDLTPHEVAVDPQDPSLAYLSYYGGGLRAIQIQCSNPDDTSTCELVEVGGYLDPMGNDFWGVETFVGDDGFTYILGSDRDSGLWIFRDP